MRIAISGASGLIGSALAADLARDDVDVARLVRRPAQSADEISWDPGGTGLDPADLQGVDAVVHLSGAPVASGRWTATRKELLRSSRIDTTRALVAGMAAAKEASGDAPAGRVPSVLICGSAIGFYGNTGDQVVDESAQPGSGFLADLVRDWEVASQRALAAGIRVVNIRSGLVLSTRGGILGSMLLPFRLGLGAKFGSGDQFMSWIGLADEVRAIRFLLEHEEVGGPVNLTAPEPVTNAVFTKALAGALHRPALLTVPAPVLRGALGEVSGELLGSIRAVPTRLTEAGFTFGHPNLGAALSPATA